MFKNVFKLLHKTVFFKSLFPHEHGVARWWVIYQNGALYMRIWIHYSLTCRQLPQLHSGGKLKPVLIGKIAIYLAQNVQNWPNKNKMPSIYSKCGLLCKKHLILTGNSKIKQKKKVFEKYLPYPRLLWPLTYIVRSPLLLAKKEDFKINFVILIAL